METLLSIYLVIGLINALIIWWAAFQPDYDDFVRSTFNEEPPSTKEKAVIIAASVFIWPAYLYWAMR